VINDEQEWQELCDAMLAMGQNLQLALEMSRTDRRKNLVIILYSHLLSLFQGVVEGRCASDRETLRKQVTELLDATFATVAAIQHRGLVDDFYTRNDRQRIFRRKRTQSLPRNVAGRIRLLSGAYFAQVAELSEYYASLHQLIESAAADGGPPSAERLMVPAGESLLLGTRQVTDFFGIRDLEKEYYKCWHSFLGLSSPAPDPS
jgi:hypothetical protein